MCSTYLLYSQLVFGRGVEGSIYSEFNWDTSKFGKDRHMYRYWTEAKNQRATVDRIGQEHTSLKRAVDM
jgi:hypothetical protein